MPRFSSLTFWTSWNLNIIKPNNDIVNFRKLLLQINDGAGDAYVDFPDVGSSINGKSAPVIIRVFNQTHDMVKFLGALVD